MMLTCSIVHEQPLLTYKLLAEGVKATRGVSPETVLVTALMQSSGTGARALQRQRWISHGLAAVPTRTNSLQCRGNLKTSAELVQLLRQSASSAVTHLLASTLQLIIGAGVYQESQSVT